MFWLIDPSHAPRERRIGAAGAALACGVTGLTDVVSVTSGDLPTYGWGFVAFNAAMVGWALTYLRGRAG